MAIGIPQLEGILETDLFKNNEMVNSFKVNNKSMQNKIMKRFYSFKLLCKKPKPAQ